MKILSNLPIIVMLLFLIGCGGGKTDETVTAEYVTETIRLETIRCQMCVSFVQKAAASVDGVEGMRVDFDRRIGTVSFDPAKTTLGEIEAAIAAAGYNANETKRDEHAYLALPDCCR